MRILEKEIAAQIEGASCCLNLPIPLCNCLLELDSIGPVSLSDLADSLQLDRSTLSRSVEALVQKGLAVREADSADRRAVVIALSPEGKSFSEKLNCSCDEYYAHLLDQITEQNRSVFVESIEQIVAAMKKTDENGKCCSNRKESFNE